MVQELMLALIIFLELYNIFYLYKTNRTINKNYHILANYNQLQSNLHDKTMYRTPHGKKLHIKVNCGNELTEKIFISDEMYTFAYNAGIVCKNCNV